MRTGTRCTTLTQLPVAFCGGRIENCAPVPGDSEPTWPLKTWSGNASTSSVDRLAYAQIGDVGFLRIGVDPGRLVVDTLNTGVPAVDEAAELDLSTCVAVPEIGARITVWSRSRWAMVERGLGLRIGRKLRDRQIGIAEQLSLERLTRCCCELRLRAAR